MIKLCLGLAMPSSVNHSCTLRLSGHTINDLYDLRVYFNLQELLALYSSGQLSAFCQSQGFVVECRALERLKILGPLTTLELSSKLCRIFGIARTPLENQCELTAQQLEQDALIIAQRNSQGQIFHQKSLGIAPAQLLPLEPVFTPQFAITNEHNKSFTIKRQLLNNIQPTISTELSYSIPTRVSDKPPANYDYNAPPITYSSSSSSSSSHLPDLEEVPIALRPVRKSWMQKIRDSRTLVPHKIATKDLNIHSYPRYAMFYDEHQGTILPNKAQTPTKKAAPSNVINALLALLQQDPSKIELLKALLVQPPHNEIESCQQLSAYEHKSSVSCTCEFVPAKCHYYYQLTGREFARPLGEPHTYPQVSLSSHKTEQYNFRAIKPSVALDTSFSKELLSFVLEQNEFALCQAILQGINTFRFNQKSHKFTDLHYHGLLRSANFLSKEPQKRTMYNFNSLLKRKLKSKS